MTAQRPDSQFTVDELVVSNWLRANGVDEWIPRDPHIRTRFGRLTYRSFNWTGPRGWDVDNLSADQDDLSDRTVPLRVPMSASVRDSYKTARAGR